MSSIPPLDTGPQILIIWAFSGTVIWTTFLVEFLRKDIFNWGHVPLPIKFLTFRREISTLSLAFFSWSVFFTINFLSTFEAICNCKYEIGLDFIEMLLIILLSIYISSIKIGYNYYIENKQCKKAIKSLKQTPSSK